FPFARPLGVAWAVTAAVAAVDAAWIAAHGWHFAFESLARLALAVAALLAPLLFGRYRNDARISATVQVGALILGFTAAGAVLSYLVVSTGAPLVDAPLSRWDAALGFDWIALWRWMSAHPSMHAALRIAYMSGL